MIKIRRSDPGMPSLVSVRGCSDTWTLSDIARGTGLTLSCVSRIFSHQRGVGMSTARRISRFLGISLDDFYTYIEAKPAA